MKFQHRLAAMQRATPSTAETRPTLTQAEPSVWQREWTFPTGVAPDLGDAAPRGFDALRLPDAASVYRGLGELLPAPAPATDVPAVVVDLETSGLGLGLHPLHRRARAGTTSPQSVRLEQWSDRARPRPSVDLLRAGGRATRSRSSSPGTHLLSFNGRSFDVPRLRVPATLDSAVDDRGDGTASHRIVDLVHPTRVGCFKGPLCRLSSRPPSSTGCWALRRRGDLEGLGDRRSCSMNSSAIQPTRGCRGSSRRSSPSQSRRRAEPARAGFVRSRTRGRHARGSGCPRALRVARHFVALGRLDDAAQRLASASPDFAMEASIGLRSTVAKTSSCSPPTSSGAGVDSTRPRPCGSGSASTSSGTPKPTRPWPSTSSIGSATRPGRSVWPLRRRRPAPTAWRGCGERWARRRWCKAASLGALTDSWGRRQPVTPPRGAHVRFDFNRARSADFIEEAPSGPAGGLCCRGIARPGDDGRLGLHGPDPAARAHRLRRARTGRRPGRARTGLRGQHDLPARAAAGDPVHQGHRRVRHSAQLAVLGRGLAQRRQLGGPAAQTFATAGPDLYGADDRCRHRDHRRGGRLGPRGLGSRLAQRHRRPVARGWVGDRRLRRHRGHLLRQDQEGLRVRGGRLQRLAGHAPGDPDAAWRVRPAAGSVGGRRGPDHSRGKGASPGVRETRGAAAAPGDRAIARAGSSTGRARAADRGCGGTGRTRARTRRSGRGR